MPTPPSEDRSFFGHPRGLSTLFFTEMWERFSYYGLRQLLIFFMTAAIIEGGFGIEREQAAAIVGIYAASVYLASLPGGWIADRLIGLRRAIWYGGVLIALGHLCVGLSSLFMSRVPFFVGLVLIVLGTGLMKPNSSVIVGDLYPESSGARRDAGFSIFYMGLNIGSFFGQLVTGLLGETLGWHFGFGAAGVGMLLGLGYYAWRAKKTLGSLGLEPTRNPDSALQRKEEQPIKAAIGVGLLVLSAVIVLSATGAITLNPQGIGQYLAYILVSITFIFLFYVFFFGGLDKDEKKRIAVIGILFLFSAIFWAAFEQAPTSLNLFAYDFTDRSFFGWTIPATWFQAVNSLFVFLCAPLFAILWIKLAKRGIDPSGPAKFAFGLLFAAIGFGLMVFAANEVLASGGKIRVSPLWLASSYFFQTLGELCLSPVGLSSITKLSPRRYVGQMMGIWFLALALGNVIAGLVGGRVDPEKLEQMPPLFVGTAIALLLSAIALWALLPLIKGHLTPTQEKRHLD